jgi:glycosyltransferase involved in cell wall biosynthesis
MRILMVISQFHPIIGGAEKQAQLLAKELIEKGLKVTLVTGWWRINTPATERIDGIKIIRNFSCWGMFGIKGIRSFGVLAYMASLGAYLLAQGKHYDLIHVHQALYPAFVSVFFGRELLHKPVLVKSGSSGMTSDISQLRQYPSGNFQLKYLVKKMDYLVATNKISRKEFIEIGYPESRIVYIPNGVKISSEGKGTYAPVRTVLTSARLSREKGMDILIKAWAQVVQHEKSLKLLILGDGPLASELRNLSKSLNLTDSVDFRGMVQDVSSYLRAADLFVLPSRTEGVSNALLEAMSQGIPCIATDVGGNPEALGKGESKGVSVAQYVLAKNGVLVRSGDVQGLSNAILYLIREGGVREEMGRRSRQYIRENYSIDLIADRYIELYQHMLSGRA